MSLEGKVALVAGASRGIGADVAKGLAKAGATVAVAARSEEVFDIRLPGTIHTVVQEIEAEGGKAIPVRLDVSNPESIIAGVKKTVDELGGGLDIIVNNAAILVPGTLETVKERHMELMWTVDLRGPLFLMREAIPLMRKAGGGHIINVSSVAGVFPGAGPYPKSQPGAGSLYGMVKAGLERLSQGLALELQDDNISVNVLSPSGMIRTPGHEFAQNDPKNPNLEFEEADLMVKGTNWICEQGVEFTGHILFDQDLCKEKGL